MIELVDTFPDVNVQPAEYKRLLGYPRDAVMSGRGRELADWARAWYAKHGRPWVYAREAQNLSLENGSILIDEVPFTSKRLRGTLEQSDACSVILVAVGAGPEVERESLKLWQEEKPDEYFFLEVYGSAVVEHLTTMAGARLCAWAEDRQLAVLPPYSPGYAEWDIAEQPRLLNLIRQTRQHALPSGLDVLESGMLRPKKSLITVFGLTRHVDRVRRLTEMVPCENCAYQSCQYRRGPYVKPPEHSQPAVSKIAENGVAVQVEREIAQPLDDDAVYSVNVHALKKWAAERLSLRVAGDGTVHAVFHFEGTTCSNMGRTLLFDYYVKLGPKEEGYPILEQRCGPAANDTGHTFMCRYMNNAEHLMVAIEQEKPLGGQSINDVLSWHRATTTASCYCEPANRRHMWGLVLETIHYALVQRQTKTPASRLRS